MYEERRKKVDKLLRFVYTGHYSSLPSSVEGRVDGTRWVVLNERAPQTPRNITHLILNRCHKESGNHRDELQLDLASA